MSRPVRWIGVALLGSLGAVVFSGGRAAAGFLDRTDAMPPQATLAPSGRVAPQRSEGMDGSYRIVSFGLLGSFPFQPANYADLEKGKHTHDWESHVPDEVQRLKGQKVSVQGFMIPMDIDPDRKIIKSFVLVPHLMNCCFGSTPIMNMRIFVATDAHTQNKLDFDDTSAVVRAYGTLDVGELVDDVGDQSLYRLNADRLIQPRNPEL
ncbi:MAG TPA: DUF3299 domain-containing protein [Elusimicrobiota bacterium]|nr:DUF3299 domain-containing protein [Elusimicrobiota bacterium]